MMGPNMQIFMVMLGTMASIANFSYDAAMINSLNIMESFSAYFQLDATTAGLNVAIIYVGSVLGVPLAGPLLDKYGRRKGLFIGTAIGLVGCILQASAHEIIQLLIGRFLLGVTFIIAGAGGPSWLMEIAPPNRRALITHGMLGSLPITGTIGAVIFLAIWDSPSDWAWRGGLMGELLGPLVALAVIPFCPESIRWLISQNREEEAFDTLISLRGVARDDPEILAEFQQITHTIRHERETSSENSWKPLLKPGPDRRRLLIATLTNIFWQTNGTNFMPYFFTLVLFGAGVTDTALLLKINVAISAWAVLANLCGIWLTSQWGRRKMFLLCTPILALSFLILGILQYYVDTYGYVSYGIGAVAICFIFQWTSFASWMILTFSYPVEILKYTQRAKGVVVSQAIGYLFGIMMTYTMPLAIEYISWKFYIINAAWIVPMVGLIWWLFPETQGKTLEEIDRIFEGDNAESWLQVIEGSKADVESQTVKNADSLDAKKD